MHSSWPFFGATSGLRQQQQQPTAADFGDRPQNGSASFDLNSFVRSVNRHGARLPVGFQFRGLNCNGNENGSTDRNAGKSLNELLTLLNDSVDRVVVGCNPEVRSNASSFASFRSGAEEKDPAALNDLIDLVSSTANEFRDINAGNASSQNSPLNVDLRAATSPKNPPEVGLRTLVHPDVSTPEESSDFPVAEPAFPVWAENSRTESATEGASLPTNPRRRNRPLIDDEAAPTGDVLAYPPELVEIYSENHTAGTKRAQLSAESLETLRQLETPRYFPGQVLRLATAAGFSGTLPARGEPSRRDWAPRTKRINFEDELWPVGPCIPGSRDFLPYFTGASARAFRCRGAERSFVKDERTMNASRSSPIFAGAGEAPAEAMETVPTRDGGDCSRESGIKEVFAGSSGDRATPLSIGFPDSGSLYDASPTKLDKSEAKSIDGEKFEAEEAESSSPEVEPFASSVAEEEDDEASAEICNGGDQVREPRACVKFPTKRTRRVCKQLKKPGRKSTASRLKRDDEDNSGRETSSTSQSPVRRSSPRLLEASPGSGEERREDERMGSVKGEDDSIETQVGMSFEIGGPRRFMGKSHAGRFRAVAKPSEMAIAEKSNLRLTDLRNFFAEDRGLPVMTERPKLADVGGLKRSSLGANQKSRLQNSPQPIWRPAGSVKVVPSSSSCSMARQSKIARLSTSGSDSRGEKPKERFSTTGSGVPVVGKNRTQGFAKGPRGPAKSCEATTRTPRSKQRPGTPRKASHRGIAEDARSEDKSRLRESFLSSESTRKTSSAKDKLSGPGSICKTAIPVLRSKTFVHQTRPEAPLRRVVSREDHTKNPKLISTRSSRSSRNSATSGPAFDTPFDSRICADAEKSHSDFVSREDHTKNPKLISARSSRSSRNSATSGPAFDTPFDSRICTDTEKSHSDFVFGSNSEIDNEEFPVELSSNDSIPRTSPKTADLSRPVEDTGGDENLREEETFEKMHRGKFPNRHAQSLRMLKDLLSNQGISVDGVKKGDRGRDAPGASRTLFEKLAILTEAAPDHRDTERERSVSSFTDAGSESATSCARSMRDAGEQCTIRNESSVVLPTGTGSEGSCDSPRTEEARAKEVSSVCTEIDEDYRRTIYVDASVSSESRPRSCEVAETQTLRNAVDKDSTTDEIIPSISKPTSNAFTETEQKSSASKEANTEDTGPEISDAASQFDPSECSTEVASGKDFADTECPSMCVNTEPPDFFVKSRGVCFRGPRKIDGDSQCNSENSKEAASGRDYVDSNGVSEYVNTDRQDYLFEDRSVEVLLPQTTEEACQVDPPSSIVNTAVGDHSLDCGETKSSMRREERSIAEVTTDRGRSLETVVVKDVDVVQWQSSTTFETSRINCSTCSSNSSVVAWRPVAGFSQRSAAEKIRSLRERVPKEAITALEIASERARNLYKAIGIYRENLVSRKVNESIVKYCESEYISQIDGPICQAIVAPCAKPCNFHEKSKIKSLLEANLKKSFELSREPSNLLIRPVGADADRSKLQEEIASLMNDLLKDAVRDIGSEAEDKNIVPEERFLQPKKRQNSPANVREGFEEKNRHEEVNLPSKNGNTSDFRLISRNSLLTFIYGTVCSLVFWALQFSISCDSR